MAKLKSEINQLEKKEENIKNQPNQELGLWENIQERIIDSQGNWDPQVESLCSKHSVKDILRSDKSFQKSARIQNQHKKLISFLCTNNEYAEKKNKENISTVSSKQKP